MNKPLLWKKPELLKDKPRQTQPQLQNAETAQAKVNEKKAAEPLKKKAYDDEMRQIDLEMKKLDLELKRS